MTVHQVRRVLLIAVLILVLLDLAAFGVLLSPMAKSREAKTQELSDLQQQFKQNQQEIGPLRGMDKKIDAAKVNIVDFYRDRIPGQYSQIDSALAKDAKANNVQLVSVTYKPDRKPVEDLQRVAIDMTITGSYVNDVKFINSMERDKVFFVINSVSLGSATNGVSLIVRAETYFRTGAV